MKTDPDSRSVFQKNKETAGSLSVIPVTPTLAILLEVSIDKSANGKVAFSSSNLPNAWLAEALVS